MKNQCISAPGCSVLRYKQMGWYCFIQFPKWRSSAAGEAGCSVDKIWYYLVSQVCLTPSAQASEPSSQPPPSRRLQVVHRGASITGPVREAGKGQERLWLLTFRGSWTESVQLIWFLCHLNSYPKASFLDSVPQAPSLMVCSSIMVECQRGMGIDCVSFAARYCTSFFWTLGFLIM